MRSVLLIGGAGFDPRSTVVARLLKQVAKCQLRGLLIRERRPVAPSTLLESAEQNIAAIKGLFPPLKSRIFTYFPKVISP